MAYWLERVAGHLHRTVAELRRGSANGTFRPLSLPALVRTIAFLRREDERRESEARHLLRALLGS